ncbi:hypothetical protein Acr_05g0008660 [Actinidia rufa]|uniref:Uncharacterized protein n=1 Tax=Actinidia rufa TaxID=165716 RepID=A0A7J0ENR5_9ERIC|nr:hypothetical protein Acr_05g0008660 [Actinidia rufa]
MLEKPSFLFGSTTKYRLSPSTGSQTTNVPLPPHATTLSPPAYQSSTASIPKNSLSSPKPPNFPPSPPPLVAAQGVVSSGVVHEQGARAKPEIEWLPKVFDVDLPKDKDKWGVWGRSGGGPPPAVVEERGRGRRQPMKLFDAEPSEDEDDWGVWG